MGRLPTMDPNLLRHYSDELAHLREVGAEFAQQFPKIASRLTLNGLEVADPYVERLLEGFAFMAARVQLKLDAEHPRLISQLLESIYPNFLSPVPSTLVARFEVDPADPNLSRGYRVPRGAAMYSQVARGQDTRCEFRTAHDVTLWPIEMTSVKYFTFAPDLPWARLPQAQGQKGGLRIKLRAGGGLMLKQLALDRLSFYIAAPDDVSYRLHELVLGAAMGTYMSGADSSRIAESWRDAGSVRPQGFDNDQALLPETLRAFSGHRLIQELAALPQRLLFFEVTDLAARLANVNSAEAELVIMFSRGDPALESLVDGGSLALFCTPAINLFRKRLDRIQLGLGAWEYHVVPDRTRPMDFEVHSIESVTGYGTGRVAQREFLPLYASHHEQARDGHGYFTVRREPRLISERARQQGPRSSYIGEEAFLSLVDEGHGPFRDDVRQLSVSAWVSNRDLPMLLPQDGSSQSAPLWRLDAAGPVSRVQVLRGPTRPITRRPAGDIGWSLVSHLTLNHLSLTGDTPEAAASALRRTLALYGPPEDVAWQRQIDGIRRLEAKPVVRRLPFKGPLTFGHGIAITLEVDELAFQGASAFLFAGVLERYFARHAAINSFTQFTLRSTQRGVVMQWAPRIGTRETV